MSFDSAREPSNRLAASLLDRDGRIVARWGPDADAVGDIPRGLTFTTSDPGGFKDSTAALSRRIDQDWPDLSLLRDIRYYGAGNRTAWEGRLQETPAHHGDDYTISPGAVGHVVELDDDPSFAEIYIDSELSKWGEASVQRKLNQLNNNFIPVGQISTGPESSGGLALAVMVDFMNVVTNEAIKQGAEAIYYGGGVDIGALLYDFQSLRSYDTSNSTQWRDRPEAGTDDVFSVSQVGTNHAQGTANGQTFTVTSSGKKYLAIQSYHLTGASGNTMNAVHAWLRPKVLGRHGVFLRGEWPNVGFYASDVIANIVSRCAPRFQFTTGPEGSIRDSDFAIPHLVFDGSVKGSDAVMATNAFHQRSWGVYDDKTFFWQPTTTYRKRWRIRRSKGHGVDLLGPQAEDAMNGVVVTFTDPAGISRTVMPPGGTAAYATSALLADTSAANPVNAAGIPRKWGELQLGFVTDVNGAIQVGAAYLQMKLESATSRGSVTVTGLIEDDETGALYPAWYMRSGDSAIVTDGDNIERRIIETTYSHDSEQLTANMDSTPHKVEALMERMGVVLVGIVE